MLYDDDPTPDHYCPLRGRRPTPQGIEPSAAERAAILSVADTHRRWGPHRIHAELCLAGNDIALEVVEVVVADLEQRAV
jgi:hypothetical protein